MSRQVQLRYGICHILEDRVIFSVNTKVDVNEKYTLTSSSTGMFILEGLGICALLYWSLHPLITESWNWLSTTKLWLYFFALFCAVAILIAAIKRYSLYSIWEIHKHQIKEVRLTSGGMDIIYVSASGQRRKRPLKFKSEYSRNQKMDIQDLILKQPA